MLNPFEKLNMMFLNFQLVVLIYVMYD